MLKLATVLGATLISIPVMAAAQTDTAQETLNARAMAAIPEARATLDDALTDYPSARFRNVQARLVRSVYTSDEGQSDKVPWKHRGGIVLIFCGEINAKNRMGGYTGWEPFALQPSQTDIVTLYSMDMSSRPMKREPEETNIAEKPKLMLSSSLYDEHVAIMCGAEAVETDPADLSDKLAF
ncbi:MULTISPECIES: hypothetical protein [Citromicrobium]|uniref:hypothetical protein n=1 Tax=Citromicrobium TaxID=72173 RepID=UPI0001DD108F|nr:MULTISPECIES: hypothetical protein [Citromicrobium]ALG60983.1 hypothetical protein WG74_09145 [Citromicrobium sp. JL477]KPM15144.1 hypothetical protein VO58_08360 [Citromicrobium sp. JL1351]KPM19503.1 hypothetical protein VM77_06150 [Citromicrobium sp. JL31]KPM26436.1 hypothetical protein VO57_09095 [Citromicrobium sp. JL2201]